MTDEITPVTNADAPIKKRRGRPPKKPAVVDGGMSAPDVAKVVTPQHVSKVVKATPVEASSVSHTTSHAPVSPLQYIFAVGRRKRAVARVFLYREGKGEMEVNGKPCESYFPSVLLRDIAGQALAHSPFKNSVRVVAKVRGGGIQGQSLAVRLGTANALLKLDATLRPTLRVRGFLTRDPREKERKKPGLKKARRGPQWAKR